MGAVRHIYPLVFNLNKIIRNQSSARYLTVNLTSVWVPYFLV
jgi:hypothetical protein